MKQAAAAVAIAACGAARAPLSYPVPAHVGALVTDDDAFAKLAAELRADLAADLAHPTARMKDERFVLAMLDGLDDNWRDATAELSIARSAETDPQLRVMMGLTILTWADAGGDPARFRAAFDADVTALPIDQVRDELAVLRTMAQVFTPSVCAQLVDQAVGPNVKNGVMSFDDAQAVVFQRYAVKRLVPVARAIDEVLGHHGIAAKTE